MPVFLSVLFPKNPAEMNVAIGFVVVNAENILAKRILAFPALA
jgi:hypothetical protein